MELLQLKYFETVAKLGNITRAAEEMFVTQPALSNTIKRLEDEIGTQLFNRNRHGVTLTEDGKILFDAVESAFNALSQAQEMIENNGRMKRGKFRIIAPSIYVYPDLIDHLISLDYDISFIAGNVSLAETERILKTREACFALGGHEFVGDEFDSVLLASAAFNIGVNNTHPFAKKQSISFMEIKDESFVTYPRGSLPREELENYCSQFGFKPLISKECNGPFEVERYVSKGFGIMLSSHTNKKSIVSDNENIILIPIKEDCFIKKRFLSWRKDTAIIPLERIKKVVIDYFANDKHSSTVV